MKQLFITLLSVFFMQHISAQDFVREVDRKTDKVLLRGKINFSDIQNESTCKWFDEGVNAYTPNAEVIAQLKKEAANYRYVIFAGTWCGDTKELLPKFYKTAKQANIDMNAMELYAVNRNKEALNNEAQLYNIKNVPTIIVMYQFREVGRIIESVHTSIEDDLVAIIDKDYQAVEKAHALKYK